MTTRSTIEALLRSEPMTGAQIRKHIGGTSTAASLPARTCAAAG